MVASIVACIDAASIISMQWCQSPSQDPLLYGPMPSEGHCVWSVVQISPTTKTERDLAAMLY